MEVYMKEGMKSYQLVLDVELMRRLKMEAARTDRTIKDLIVEAIMDLFDKLESEREGDE